MDGYISHFTFYDIVGYFVPGAFVLFAFDSVAIVKDGEGSVSTPSSAGGWFAAILLSYVVGHFLQAIASRMSWRDGAVAWTANSLSNFECQMLNVVSAHYDIHADSILSKLKSIDELGIDSPEKSMFIARQGFFRGLTLALSISAGVFAHSGFFGHGLLYLGIHLSGFASVVFAGIYFTAAFLFIKRYSSFVRYELGSNIGFAYRHIKDAS